MDLRGAIRYRLRAPVVFSWKGPGADHLTGEGVTRDVSAAGVFVESPVSPPPASTIELEISFPSFRFGPHTLSLVSQGRVVRVENSAADEQNNGFAIVTAGLAFPEGSES